MKISHSTSSRSWSLRGLILFGFFFQGIFIIRAPLAKRKSSKNLIQLIWVAYFITDWTTNFALGVTSNSGDDMTKTHGEGTFEFIGKEITATPTISPTFSPSVSPIVSPSISPSVDSSFSPSISPVNSSVSPLSPSNSTRSSPVNSSVSPLSPSNSTRSCYRTSAIPSCECTNGSIIIINKTFTFRTIIVNETTTGVTLAPWSVRGLLLLGLFLQAFLIICAPQRKRKSSKTLIQLIWVAYFLAQWTANFALAVISNSGGDLTKTTDLAALSKKSGRDPSTDTIEGIHADLLAFWVPFLLIQLGGADTIISSCIQDLSGRGITRWCFHAGLTVYVFSLSHPWPSTKLLLIKLLLLVAGIAKYAECGYAVNRASLKGLKKSMLKHKQVDHGPTSYNSKREVGHIPDHAAGMLRGGELQSDVAVLERAHGFFQWSRGLLIGLLFSFEERRVSRMFFQQITPEEAYKLIAVELNFIYDSLFTKAFVFHSKMGYFIRTISFTILVMALTSFHKYKKHGFGDIDIKITYILLYGAITMDVASFLEHIFSDWTVVAFGTYMQSSCVAFIFGKYLKLKRSTLATSRTTNCFKRWSMSVTTFSFLDYSIKKRSGGGLIRDMLLLKGTGVTTFRSSRPLTGELWKFIFKELKRKSMSSDDNQIGTDIYSVRGEWILRNSKWSSDCGHLLTYVDNYDYAQSIILWHIVTEICYITDKSNGDWRGHCKTLSCYMLYLLIKRPIAMSLVAGIYGEFAFRDTSAEVQLFFTRKNVVTGLEAENVFTMMLEEHSPEPVDVDGIKTRSLFSDACALSKELRKLGDKKWEILSEMWVEMLSYAASHCEAKNHADFLTRGGELVTFVWLLMAHLGIMETLVQTSANQVNDF